MITTLIQPVPAPRMSKQDKWASTRSAAAARYVRYCEELRRRKPLMELLRTGDPMRIDFFLRMPPSWSDAKKAANVGMPHRSKPDLDNLVKALYDATFHQRKPGDQIVWATMAVKRWDIEGYFTVQTLDIEPATVVEVKES